MSSPMVKGVKRSPLRSTSRQSATTGRTRGLAGKSVRLKPITKRSSTGKAPAKKAKKSSPTSALRGKAAGKKKAPPAKSRTLRSHKLAKPRKAPGKAPLVRSSKVKPVQSKRVSPPKATIARIVRQPVPPPPPPPKPTRDEAAALKAFEKAHKEFSRGRFAEARNQFRALVEKYSGVSEVTARSRTYLAIAEARLRTETMLPRDADSLYDRGVIELNRGEYVAAQELFERALKREPNAGHVHYGLAATRARLGSIDLALESLGRALDAQPNLRIRAQHDQDLSALRNDPDFDKLVFAPRP
jgi:tetratricopeptide (TPR) repeat protein